MHSGPIKLSESIKMQISSLVNLGNILQLYSISNFVHILDVNQKIMNDMTTIMDLQEVIMLCDVICDHPRVDEHLINNINTFKDVIRMFIIVASQPSRPCGLWNNIALDFDEDQYL